jgi:hypothetical protein
MAVMESLVTPLELGGTYLIKVECPLLSGKADISIVLGTIFVYVTSTLKPKPVSQKGASICPRN